MPTLIDMIDGAPSVFMADGEARDTLNSIFACLNHIKSLDEKLDGVSQYLALQFVATIDMERARLFELKESLTQPYNKQCVDDLLNALHTYRLAVHELLTDKFGLETDEDLDHLISDAKHEMPGENGPVKNFMWLGPTGFVTSEYLIATLPDTSKLTIDLANRIDGIQKAIKLDGRISDSDWNALASMTRELSLQFASVPATQNDAENVDSDLNKMAKLCYIVNFFKDDIESQIQNNTLTLFKLIEPVSILITPPRSSTSALSAALQTKGIYPIRPASPTELNPPSSPSVSTSPTPKSLSSTSSFFTGRQRGWSTLPLEEDISKEFEEEDKQSDLGKTPKSTPGSK